LKTFHCTLCFCWSQNKH